MELTPSTILACLEKPPALEKHLGDYPRAAVNIARRTQQFLEISPEVLDVVAVAKDTFEKDVFTVGSDADGLQALQELTRTFHDAMHIINPDDSGFMFYIRRPEEPVAVVSARAGTMSVSFEDDGLYVNGLVSTKADEDWGMIKAGLDGSVIEFVKPDDEEMITTTGQVITFMIAVILIAERFIDVEEAHLPRAERRRLQRVGGAPRRWVTANLTRRASAKNQGDVSSVDWSHRWMVRPHWRNQWYPSLGVHKMKYIHPYIKGPEDKELIVKPVFFK